MEPDCQHSAYWYVLAAEQGIITAQYNLRLMFTQGIGVPHDLVITYMRLDIAALKGAPDAAAQRELTAPQMNKTMVATAQQSAQSWSDTH